jgi:hypothetical protein
MELRELIGRRDSECLPHIKPSEALDMFIATTVIPGQRIVSKVVYVDPQNRRGRYIHHYVVPADLPDTFAAEWHYLHQKHMSRWCSLIPYSTKDYGTERLVEYLCHRYDAEFGTHGNRAWFHVYGCQKCGVQRPEWCNGDCNRSQGRLAAIKAALKLAGVINRLGEVRKTAVTIREEWR